MSKAKYVVINGISGLGIIWEGENGDLMFINDGNKIDINNDIEIFTCGTQERVKIDMRDVILNAIKPKEKELVLSKEETESLLKCINIVKEFGFNINVNINKPNSATEFLKNLKLQVNNR